MFPPWFLKPCLVLVHIWAALETWVLVQEGANRPAIDMTSSMVLIMVIRASEKFRETIQQLSLSRQLTNQLLIKVA